MAVIDVIYAIGSTQSTRYTVECHTYISPSSALLSLGSVVSTFSEMYTFVFNYVKILDDIHFCVICFVVVFYTNILRNVFSLICLTYNKCFNNMFCFFFLILVMFFNNFNSNTIACFHTNMLQNLC